MHDHTIYLLRATSVQSSNPKIVLQLANGEKVVTSTHSLLGYILPNINSGTKITDIVVHGSDSDNKAQPIPLTEDVWISQLLQGPWKQPFLRIWNELGPIEVQRSIQLESLKEVPHFEYNAKIFIRDLRRFQRDGEAWSRINETSHPYFLGPPYFSESLVERILQLPIRRTQVPGQLAEDTHLAAELAKLHKHNDCGDDVCRPCHLKVIPIYEIAFDLKYAEFEEQVHKVGKFAIAGVESSGKGRISTLGIATKKLREFFCLRERRKA